jgi:thiamine-monophosphate kinase
VRESELLTHIYTRSRDLTGAFPHILVGPGDDCAVVATPSGDQLLLKVDQVISGRHFRPIPATPIDLVARKAIARAVSDIAAMGGTPSCALAAATLPPDCSYANELFDAMARWALHWGCPLVGGDIGVGSDGTEALVLGVTIIGHPHATRGPVLRSGARPGDAVYVTGSLGGSLDPATGLGRHLAFEPRLAEARWLCDLLGPDLHALMDISDGLGRDAARLARASGGSVNIDASLIPLGPGAAGWRSGAADGEDYELLLAVPANAPVPSSCPVTGTAVTRIGVIGPAPVLREPNCIIHTPQGPTPGDELGWDHGQAQARPGATGRE